MKPENEDEREFDLAKSIYLSILAPAAEKLTEVVLLNAMIEMANRGASVTVESNDAQTMALRRQFAQAQGQQAKRIARAFLDGYDGNIKPIKIPELVEVIPPDPEEEPDE